MRGKFPGIAAATVRKAREDAKLIIAFHHVIGKEDD
jgi:hypothetical protein